VLSKLDALLIPLEYQKADTVLQLSDLFTQRRLGDLQSVGGTREVEFFGKSYSSELKSNLRLHDLSACPVGWLGGCWRRRLQRRSPLSGRVECANPP
jgi:hypothetical protein